ncbi:AMP-binding protein [Streptomyces sp. ODS28]|uniref:AMP-binding protein n=1 Tax=Streptomyces sp. ODS28 TaxID=3136688 RepID=UPI0031EF1F20
MRRTGGAGAGAGAQTVVEAFLDSADRAPDRLAFHVIERSEAEAGEEHALSHADVRGLLARSVGGLAEHGIGAGERVLLILPTSRDFLAAYLGCLYAGAAPLVLAEPLDGRTAQYAEHVRRTAELAGARHLITTPERAAALAPLVPLRVLTPGHLRGAPAELDKPYARPDTLAQLQATSGSTGTPRLAAVRHGNLTANVGAIAEAIRARPDDVLVSWLPLFHDMGLVGISYALWSGIPMVLSDPVNFLRNPLAWPGWIHRFRGTLSPAPSSAFHICARVAGRRPPRDLDLSCWRVALCGAEPVREGTMREFQEAFGPFGLPETTLRPVYGLAEATLAVTISDVTRPYAADHVDAESVAARGRAVVPRVSDGGPRGTSVMCVGRVLPGHGLRVTDAEGSPLPERWIGEVEVSGPSVIEGYLGGASAEPGAAGPELKRPDGWLRTGDLGYLADDELYVTGRSKDLVIIAGRNCVPEQIESFVEAAAGGPRRAAVVAVGVPDPALGTEQLHLLLDERMAEGRDRREITGAVSEALAEVFGLGGVTYHWVRRSELPRTTSGKIQRHLCRRLIEERYAAAVPTEKSP